ncbi:acylphosphatase [Candidatus Micrarchaeota archaeon]|nr:acylphosphatase [Candidatus Micrarchaeota archaeon]
MAERLHIIITGDVQGVFFRAGVQGEARKRGISGWVRNVPDGTVEVMAEGGRAALESLLEWCSHGPAGASVTEVKSERASASGEFADFIIRR